MLSDKSYIEWYQEDMERGKEISKLCLGKRANKYWFTAVFPLFTACVLAIIIGS